MTVATPASDLFIGLMSGTSLDGVDGVLVDFRHGTRVLQHASCGFTPGLRAELLALNTPGGQDELHRAALAANALVAHYAQVVQQLLQRSGVATDQVAAIGAHGQTVRHRPQLFDGTGYTLQLNAPACWPSAAASPWSPICAAAMWPPGARGAPGAGLPPGRLRPGRPDHAGAQHRRHCQPQRAGCGRCRARLRLRPRQCADGRLVPAPHRPAL
jgi:1,6-anhydro-N-acetylmuramate kinase